MVVDDNRGVGTVFSESILKQSDICKCQWWTSAKCSIFSIHYCLCCYIVISHVVIFVCGLSYAPFELCTLFFLTPPRLALRTIS